MTTTIGGGTGGRAVLGEVCVVAVNIIPPRAAAVAAVAVPVVTSATARSIRIEKCVLQTPDVCA